MKLRFRSQQIFFGLSDEYIEQVYESFFFLKYHGGFSFTEAYNLPIQIRNWFVQRLIKQLEREREEIERVQKGGK
jgi:hypothetical protein